jgi:hypothetical protein
MSKMMRKLMLKIGFKKWLKFIDFGGQKVAL